MNRLEKILLKARLLRYSNSYRNNGNRETINEILSKNYMQILDDLDSNNAKINRNDFDDDDVQKALSIREAIDVGLDYKILLNKKYDSNQVNVLVDAMQNGLTTKQVKKIAKLKFSAEQMSEISEGYKEKLSKKQIDFFKKPDYTARQMSEIRNFMKTNPSAEQMSLFENNNLHHSVMREMRIALENKTMNINKIKQDFLPKIQFASTYMSRIGLQKGLDSDVIHSAIDEMVSRHECWDKKEFKKLTHEICDEIADRTDDISGYFAEKFVMSDEQDVQNETEKVTNKSMQKKIESKQEIEQHEEISDDEITEIPQAENNVVSVLDLLSETEKDAKKNMILPADNSLQNNEEQASFNKPEEELDVALGF